MAYQLVHAVVLLVIGVLLHWAGLRAFVTAAVLLLLGVVLFSRLDLSADAWAVRAGWDR